MNCQILISYKFKHILLYIIYELVITYLSYNNFDCQKILNKAPCSAREKKMFLFKVYAPESIFIYFNY